MGLRFLVTGGSGFIGTNVVDWLADQGSAILNLSATPPRNPLHARFYHHCDIRNHHDLLAQVRNFRPDYVIHLAARTDLHGQTLADYSANVAGVRNLVDVVNATSSVRHCIYASSRLVFAIDHSPAHDYDYKPSTLYGESKCLGEQIVLSQGESCVPWTLVRPTSIWGEWFAVPYRTFFDSVIRGRYVHPGRRVILKSFGYVGNTVHQIRALLSAPISRTHGKVFFLADYPPIDVLHFAGLIASAAHSRPVRQVPLSFLKAVALLGDLSRSMGIQEPPLTTFRLNNLTTNMVYNLDREAEVYGHLPYSLLAGVGRTLRWMDRITPAQQAS